MRSILSLVCLENNHRDKQLANNKITYLSVFIAVLIINKETHPPNEGWVFPQRGNFVSVFHNLASQRL